MSKEKEYKSDKWFGKKVVFILVILTITFVCFLPTLNNKFLNWDDDIHLTANLSVHSFDIKHIFTSAINNTYIPLTILSFAIEHYFFGYNPFVYHLNNLLLHLAVTGLVFLFTLRLGVKIWTATFAALLFGIHPMHVESVAWVTERKDVLYAFFYMMALCSYLHYLEEKKVGSYVLTIVLGVLSVLAKPMALSLPLIMFLCDWVKGRKFERKVFLEKILHFLCIIPIVWLTYRLHARIPGDSLVEGSLIWIWSLTFYIWKFLFPIILIPFYSLPKPISLFNPYYVLAISVLFMLLIYFVRYRRNRWLIFAGLFYFLSIFFLLQYDTFDSQIVADRFMYLPSVGICILLGVLWERILGNLNKRGVTFRNAGYLCLIILFSALCVKTYFQNKVWKNSISLWTYVLCHSHDRSDKAMGIAYVKRGIAYINEGEYDLALSDLNEALKDICDYDFDKSKVYQSRGLAYLGQRRYDSALTDFNEALEVDSDYADAYNSRGMMHGMKGEYELAADDFTKALEKVVNYDVDTVKIYRNRGLAYLRQKKYNFALIDYNKALSINFDFPEAYNERGMLYGMMGDHNLALCDLNKAIVINPEFLEAYNNRGIVYMQMGSYDLAIADFDKALRLDPYFIAARNNRNHIREILSAYGNGKSIQE